MFLCGAAAAETVYSPESGRMWSTDWDGGADLGRIVELAECSGTIEERVCTPLPQTLSYTLTIPESVNLSRAMTAEIFLSGLGWGFTGNCMGPDFEYNEIIWVNGVQVTDCPFNQPVSQFEWEIPIDPALLHTGVNTIEYDAAPWKQYEDVYGNTLYGGWTGVDDIRLTLQYTTAPPPKLTALHFSTDLFLTGHEFEVSPEVSGESPDWEIVGISYAITNQTTGNHDLYRVLPDTRNLTYTPAPGKYGKKLLEARMHARDTMTGKRVISEIITPITIYFEKGQYPHWVDDDSDGQPNWFEYWKADTAVPDIGNVTYDGAGDGYGVSNATGTYIFPLAATQHYTTPIVIASTGESFGGPGTTGVDCAAEVVAHELYHTDVRWKWQPGFEWYGLNDTDEEHVHAVTFENTSYYFDDDLPDSYEDTVSLTDSQFLTDTHGLADIKSEVYKFYGDQEYMAMRAGDSKKGVPENDWAYPGLQAGVRRTGAPMTVYPVPAGCSGACDIVSEPLPGDAGTGVSETPLDGNGNTLFDILTVGNDITVTQDGQHEIVAVLSGERGFGPEVIAIQRNVTELSAGSHAVTAVFRGTDISSAGIDGPYTMTLSWRHEYRENGPSPSATWQTAAYASTQFEPVSAGFAGTATGAPSGTDLAAAIPLTVNVPGTYTVEGYLEDPDGQVIAHATATAAYPAGAGEAVLVFDGDAIAAHHRDGIYRFTGFRILDAAGALVGRLADAGTVTITSDTFGTLQPFLSDSYADAGGQLTADGRYGVLSISAGMDAPAAGDYYYSATLFDANNNRVQTISDRLWVDAAGPVTIPFNFNGKIIASNRVNGTFTLRSFEVYGPGGGVDRRPCAYTTSAYAYTEFDQPAIVITGNVTDFPVDYDGNGLYDALRVGFDVEVGYTGCSTTGCAATFPISATLTGPGGSVISVTGSFPLLERYMTHHVTLDFDGTDINGAEIDGPYNVADLTAGFSYPSVYREPYLTAAYDHAQFEPAAILTGWVRDGDGFPVAGATIQAFENSGLTNVAGYYRLVYGESQSGGVSVVPPASSGLEGGSEIRSVEPGSTTFCNFTLYRYASLYGTVMAENGTLLTTGFVRAKGPSEKVFTLGTWNNGSYRLSSLKPGEYTVTYYPSAADLVANTTSGLLLPPGESREWNIVSYNPRALSGTVRDIAGTPVEGAEVSITDGPITSSYAIETDAAGSYAFSRLAPGMSTLYIEPPYGSGLVANTSTVSIALADTAVVHDIVLVPEPEVPEVMWPAIDPPEGRVPLTVAFTDRSTGYPTSWFWDFGDGTTSTDQHPLHTYTEAGTYTVSLTVINAYGSDSYAFTNCVHATDPRLVLPTGRLDPGSTGTSPLAAGDIEAAQEIRCALLYDPAVVRLDGVTAASARVETVGSAIDNTAGRADITITFAGGMQSVGDTALLADLQFTATGSEGDATTLTAVYADQVSCGGSEGCLPGDPEVLTNLTVIDGSIRIGAANPLPVPAFTAAPPAGNAPLAVTFDAAASGVLSPTGWLWAFGDGATSSVPNPSHTYTAPGMYDVSVTVTNGTGSWPFARQGCVAVSPEGAAATYVFVKSFGSEGSGSFGEAQFLYPEGIAVHPSGNLYITDPGNSRVQIVSPDGQYIGAFGSEGTGDGQFLYLRGIAADASGNVYVTDVRGHRVQVFSASGDYLGQWGGVGTAAGQLNLPSRIACDADGNLYVTELGNHRVQKFTPAGASLGMWGTFGSGDGQFTYPGGLAIDSSGNIYVAEGSTNHRVQKFDQAMNFVAAWGDAGSGDGQFQFPADIAVAADGTVFVADSSNNRVQAFSADGEYLTQWGSSGSGTGQFNYPYGVAVSSDGLVYVVDNENSRIQVFKRYSPAGLAANFAVNTTAGAVPLAVQFTDTSTGSPTGWDWDFGDRTSAADQNPVHVYTTSGTYTVSLNVTDGSTSDMVTRIDLIVVTPPPSSDEYGPDGTDPDYDGNGDAIPDWQQENVTSLHATTGDYVTLAVSPPAVFAGVTAIDNPSPADAPPATVFPVGFFSFAITGIAPGGSTTVELFLPADMVPDTYYKFGLTSDDPVPHWYPFPYDGTTGAEIAGSVVTLHLVDGGCGDSDLLADGEIADPGAPAQVTNRPPELDPVGNKNVNEGELLEFMVTATDPDMGDVLAYSALNLPASAIFTGQTFSWTPGYDAAGIYENIVFEVSDGNFADSETISITVADMNRAPELDPVGNKMGNEGELLEFTISATDPDTGDVLAYSASNLPAGAAFVDQKFSWTPGHDAAGTYENILFEVSDGGLADSETISITVAHVNRPPELDPVGSRNVNEGDLLEFTITANDPDTGDLLSYSVLNLPAGATFVGQTFSWTPGYDTAGLYENIIFGVADGDLTDSETIAISVTNVNRAPALDPVGNRNVNEGELLEFAVSATDPDTGDGLTYSALNLPAGATFTGQTFSWTPGFGTSGSYPGIVLEVSDGDLADSEAIVITVGDVNRPPELNPVGNRNVNEGELLEFIVSAADPDTGDILAYSVEKLPFGATFVGQTFSWTPGYDTAGLYDSILFEVSDGESKDSETISITVANINRPPVMEPVGSKNVNEGWLLEFAVTATDPDTGDMLSYSARNLPAGATFTDQTFSWTPGYDAAGSYTNVVFEVSDGDLTDSESIAISVADINRAPVLDPIGSKNVNEGELLEFMIMAIDPDTGDVLSYAASNLPSGATFIDGFFAWTPADDQAGEYNITFTATDTGGLSASQPVFITVVDIDDNNPPAFTPIADKYVDEGDLLTFELEASDPDGDILIYSADSLPAGADLSGSAFSWIPSYTQAGAYTITFTATDPDGLADVAVTNITVRNVNQAPVLDPIGNRTIVVNLTLSFIVTASDPDGDVPTVHAEPLPSGATFDTGTRAFSWTPSQEQTGIYQMTFTASDPKGLEDTEPITITVTDTEQPAVLGVYIDIKPGSCPNAFNDNGILPVAILGTEEFDILMIDPATVRLIACDDECHPEDAMVFGVAPVRWSWEKVAEPVNTVAGDCGVCDIYNCWEADTPVWVPDALATEGGFWVKDYGDEYTDLTLKFDAKDVAAFLDLDGSEGCIKVQLVGHIIREDEGDGPGLAFSGCDTLWVHENRKGKAD